MVHSSKNSSSLTDWKLLKYSRSSINGTVHMGKDMARIGLHIIVVLEIDGGRKMVALIINISIEGYSLKMLQMCFFAEKNPKANAIENINTDSFNSYIDERTLKAA